MKKITSHEELNLNYFRAKSSSPAESSRASTTKPNSPVRRACGFRTFRVTEIALYHALGKLPPNAAHRFY
jgi:transposase